MPFFYLLEQVLLRSLPILLLLEQLLLLVALLLLELRLKLLQLQQVPLLQLEEEVELFWQS